MNGRTLTTLVATLVTGGLYAAGCSTGGGGGGGSAAAGISFVGSGSLQQGLPDPQYATYQFNEVGVNAVAGARVTAITAAAVNTAVYIGNFPGGSVSLVDDQSVTFTGNLFYQATSMAADGGAVFAATGTPLATGGGDVYQLNAQGGWSIAIDSPNNESAVGLVANDRVFGGTSVYAAHGSRGAGGALLRRNSTTGQFDAVAALNSTVPSAIGGSEGRPFIGGQDAFGSSARLLRLEQGTSGPSLVTVNLPASGRVTSMVSVATVASGSIIPIVSEVLVVAVGNFDQNGNATGGALIATDGVARFETMASYIGDAPVGVMLQDLGLVVVTARGRLFHRERDGRWVEETLPAGITGIDAAVSRDATSIVMGCRTSTGAKLVRRIGGGVVQTRDRFYRPDVKAVLANRCASCHVSPGIPAAVAAMGLSLQAANDMTDHNTVRARVNLTTPASSVLLVKATGGSGHLGGAVLSTTSGDYAVLLDWVTQGARFEAAPTVTQRTYVADIRPILMDCLSCHNTATNFRLSNNLSLNQADHAEVLQEVNMGAPETSNFLRKPTNQAAHGGGVRFNQQDPRYATILQWIQQGARFQ